MRYTKHQLVVILMKLENSTQIPQKLYLASLWIRVERAINKIKNFHMWDRVIPLHQTRYRQCVHSAVMHNLT